MKDGSATLTVLNRSMNYESWANNIIIFFFLVAIFYAVRFSLKGLSTTFYAKKSKNEKNMQTSYDFFKLNLMKLFINESIEKKHRAIKLSLIKSLTTNYYKQLLIKSQHQVIITFPCVKRERKSHDHGRSISS